MKTTIVMKKKMKEKLKFVTAQIHASNKKIKLKAKCQG